MLKCFLDCRDPRPELFEGLEIARDRAFWDRHFGKYPVILLSLKDMRMNTFEDNYAILVQTISWLVHSFAYLKDSPSLDDTDREQYERYRRGTADKAELCASLRWLSRMLCAHHGQRCVILLDEYDVPLNRAHLKNYYDQAVDVIRPLMGMALKVAPSFDKLCDSARKGLDQIDRHPTLRQRLLGHRRRRNPTLRRRVLPQGLRRRPGRRPQRPAVKSATQPKPKGVPKWALLLASKC